MDENLGDYYDLESYLFKTVNNKFKVDHYLNAADFFCIIIWKANRAKTTVINRLKKKGDLDKYIKSLTSNIYKAHDMEEKLKIIMDKDKGGGFLLPMASAILAVLYPNDFTVYDIRVCNSLETDPSGEYHKLAHKTKFSEIWAGYQKFKNAVLEINPTNLSLRDKDRYLWGMSFKADLDKLLRS